MLRSLFKRMRSIRQERDSAKEENKMKNVELKNQVSKAIVWSENWTKVIVENEETSEIWMLNKKTGKGILWLREYHVSEEEMMA